MATEVVMPKLGFAMTEGVLANWLVEDGATVTEGQAIYELETEKAVQEVESPAAGVIRIEAKAGETYPVGERLGVVQ
ncbi:biotin/lipoyl-containing protein [Luteimonas sp. A501]